MWLFVFLGIVWLIDLFSKIPVGQPYIVINTPEEVERLKKQGGTWEFDSLDDAMEFRELRESGWKGDINDYYCWKEEE